MVIVGPTGSGKSALALRAARELAGEIVNCDSLQVYRGFDIGTAKPTREERAQVPHHLFDILSPEENFTAGEYARRARQVISEIAERGRVPVVVGGTGFYLRALLEGLSPAPRRDPALRACLLAREERRPGILHRLLRRLDPGAAARIHPNDRNKTLRAIEIRVLSGQSAAEVFQQGRKPLSGFEAVRIGLSPPRSALYRAIDLRLEIMFATGLIEETKQLLAAGISEKTRPFESLGYKEILQYLKGELTLEGALAAAQQATRRYAKRQMTWFRRERNVQWLHGFGGHPGIQEEALALLVRIPSTGWFRFPKRRF